MRRQLLDAATGAFEMTHVIADIFCSYSLFHNQTIVGSDTYKGSVIPHRSLKPDNANILLSA